MTRKPVTLLARRIVIEVEELFPAGQGWVWRQLQMPSEHEAWKWANRKKRSRDIRNLCIAIDEGGRVSRFSVKSRFGHRVVAPTSVRIVCGTSTVGADARRMPG